MLAQSRCAGLRSPRAAGMPNCPRGHAGEQMWSLQSGRKDVRSGLGACGVGLRGRASSGSDLGPLPELTPGLAPPGGRESTFCTPLGFLESETRAWVLTNKARNLLVVIRQSLALPALGSPAWFLRTHAGGEAQRAPRAPPATAKAQRAGQQGCSRELAPCLPLLGAVELRDFQGRRRPGAPRNPRLCLWLSSQGRGRL